MRGRRANKEIEERNQRLREEFESRMGAEVNTHALARKLIRKHQLNISVRHLLRICGY